MTTIFNFSLLSKFSTSMYQSLLDKHHLSTKTAKLIEWKEGYQPIRGYLFIKDNKKYALGCKDDDEVTELLNLLPIKVTNTDLYDSKGNEVIHLITKYKSFTVKPEPIYSFHDLVNVDEIKHGNPEAWTLYKILALSSRFSRYCARVCAGSEFGKSSYFKVINHLISKSYVITNPRSVPGICLGISEDGVLVIDEVSGNLEAQNRRAISNILFQLGDLAPNIKLGTAGSMAHGTKALYDTPNLSGIVLFNPIHYYSDKEKFFDYMFSNSPAINNRFLPLRLPDGKLDISQFSDSKHLSLDSENRQVFINFMKSAAYVQSNWKKEVEFDYVKKSLAKYDDISGRHKESFTEICNFIYLYAKDSEHPVEVYEKFEEELYAWYKAYDAMLNDYDVGDMPEVEDV